MQLLGRSSAEGKLPGLARVAARFEPFPKGNLPVPHMGWNVVDPVTHDPIFDPDISELRYYFTHTYYAVCEDPELQIGATTYGCTFASAYRSEGTCGVQFHPEKSHSFGLSLLSRWLDPPC
jgi:glutamine amidotransferase